jgi:hypothetical protein
MRTQIALTALCGLLYLGVFPYYRRINNPNEMVRVYMTVALSEEGTFAIEGIQRRWGYVNDKARFGAHLYSSKAPGTSYLGVPVYLAHRALARALGHVPDKREIVLVLRLGSVVMPSLIFLWFFCGFLERRARAHPRLGRAVFVSVAAGSLLYAYGILFVSHTLNAACAFGALMALEAVPPSGTRGHARAALAGLLCASATLFEYPAALATLVVGVYGLHALWRSGSRLRLVSFLLGGLPAALATAAFHRAAFGDVLSPGYAHLENAAFRSNIGRGFFGASHPSLEAIGRLLADPSFGLFVGTPILLFAVLGVPRALRERRAETVACLAVFVLMTLFVSALNNWRGGWTIGPRYLSTVVPFLAPLALTGLQSAAERRPTVASLAAVIGTVLALALSGLTSALYPHVPEVFTFPPAQLTLPLLRDGYAPYSLGWLVGLAGVASLLPVGLGFAGLLLFVARPRDLAIGTILALALLAAAVHLSHTSEVQRSSRGFIERTWEPPPRGGGGEGRAAASVGRGES